MEVDPDSDTEHFRKFIQYAILYAIRDALVAGTMTVDEASEIAGRTLELITSGQTIEESYASALKLLATFDKLMPALPTIVKEYKLKYKTDQL